MITVEQAVTLLERLFDSTDGAEMKEALQMAIYAVHAKKHEHQRKDDSLLARMAGNIAAGMIGNPDISEKAVIDISERMAKGLLQKIRTSDQAPKRLLNRNQHYQTGADSCSCGGLWPCDG